MPITRINHFEAKKENVEQLHAFMESICEKIKDMPGCRSVLLLRSTENPAHLAVVEEWESIEAHQKAASAIPPETMKTAKALFAKPPVGEYYQ